MLSPFFCAIEVICQIKHFRPSQGVFLNIIRVGGFHKMIGIKLFRFYTNHLSSLLLLAQMILAWIRSATWKNWLLTSVIASSCEAAEDHSGQSL